MGCIPCTFRPKTDDSLLSERSTIRTDERRELDRPGRFSQTLSQIRKDSLPLQDKTDTSVTQPFTLPPPSPPSAAFFYSQPPLPIPSPLNTFSYQQPQLSSSFPTCLPLAAKPSTSTSDSSPTASSTASEQSDVIMDLLENGGADTTSSSASTSTSSVSQFGSSTENGGFLNTSTVTSIEMLAPDDSDLQPMLRDRCNTWPMRRPQLEPPQQNSPLMHEQIPEEDSDLFGSNEQCSRLGANTTNGSSAMLHSPDGSTQNFASDMTELPGTEDAASAAAKKTTTRRNAWGNMSYAELITTAIMQSPEKRLTLSQVYEWMVQNVAYFRDKGDSNSSAGWKKPEKKTTSTSSSPVFSPSSSEMNDSLDDEYPEPRGRCYTWPMQQFVYDNTPLPPLQSHHLNPYHHHQPPLPHMHPHQLLNMSSLTSSGSSGSSIGGGGATTGSPGSGPLPPPSSSSSSSTAVAVAAAAAAATQQTVGQMLAATVPSCTSGILGMSMNLSQGGGPMPPKKKRCRKKPTDQLAQKKPNPWGEESYSDIIAKALESAPDGRLKLNEIYQWFSDNIPYFRERSSQEEAAGWKNSIRHNLSLHSRFMRIQNEGAGKSSWWVINPEAKPGRNPRRTRERSNTIETTTKAVLEKTRRGAKKRIKERGLMGSHTGLNGSSQAGSLSSIQHQDLYDDDSIPGSFENITSFRSRTQSNLSVPGSSSRVSPAVGELFDDLEYPPWEFGNSTSSVTIPSDIVDRTDQMRIDGSTHVNGVQIKQEPKPIKTEPIAPPSYHELNSVRGPCAQNPLLRNPIVPSTNFKPMPLPQYGNYQNGGSWLTSAISAPLPNIQSCGVVAAQHNVACSSALPIDLENLTLPDQPLMDNSMDVDALIRHEIDLMASQAAGHQLNFNL